MMKTSLLKHLPDRTSKPRTNGMTMVMDKGLSLRQAEDLIDVGEHLVDFLKLGFGTSLLTPRVEEKIQLYRQANMEVYCGGTLFEAFFKGSHSAHRNSAHTRFSKELGLEMWLGAWFPCPSEGSRSGGGASMKSVEMSSTCALGCDAPAGWLLSFRAAGRATVT